MTKEQFAQIEKPSELLRVALEDLKKAESSIEYIVEMGAWHDPLENGFCAVCLAGSVMAFTLGADIQQEFMPASYNPNIKYKLRALDHLRKGDISIALRTLGTTNCPIVDRFITPFESANPEGFYADTEKLIEDLEAVGL